MIKSGLLGMCPDLRLRQQLFPSSDFEWEQATTGPSGKRASLQILYKKTGCSGAQMLGSPWPWFWVKNQGIIGRAAQASHRTPGLRRLASDCSALPSAEWSPRISLY